MKTEEVNNFINTFIEMNKKAKIEQMSAICNISEEEYNKLIEESESDNEDVENE